MAKRDLYNNISVSSAVVPQVLTATNTSSGIDVRGFQSATMVVHSGAIVSSGNFTPKMQESDDNSTFTDVASTDLLGSFPTALAASSVYRVGYKGSKRYLRSVVTLNSGTSIAAGVTFVLGNAEYKPVP